MENRTSKGVKGVSGNPGGRFKDPPKPPPPGYASDQTDVIDRRVIRNIVLEARRFSGLAIDTLVELTRDNHADSTRYNAAAALLDRGYGRPAQSLDLHLSADAITKRLTDMSDAELAALEARMIASAPVVIEHVNEPQADGDNPDGSDTDAEQDGDGGADDAGELPDDDAEDSPPDAPA